MENFTISNDFNSTKDSLLDATDVLKTEKFTEQIPGSISEPNPFKTTEIGTLALSNTTEPTSVFNLFETTGSLATEETTMVPIQEVS